MVQGVVWRHKGSAVDWTEWRRRRRLGPATRQHTVYYDAHISTAYLMHALLLSNYVADKNHYNNIYVNVEKCKLMGNRKLRIYFLIG